MSWLVENLSRKLGECLRSRHQSFVQVECDVWSHRNVNFALPRVCLQLVIIIISFRYEVKELKPTRLPPIKGPEVIYLRCDQYEIKS